MGKPGAPWYESGAAKLLLCKGWSESQIAEVRQQLQKRAEMRERAFKEAAGPQE
jgi:hypothetical protein